MSAVKAPPTLDDYTIVIEPDDNGTFFASVPAIQGCYSVGRSRQEALDELSGVFDMSVELAEELGEEMPPDISPDLVPRAS